MSKINVSTFSVALLLALGNGISAADAAMSKADYSAAKSDITAKYKIEKAACKSMTGNAKDICVEEAKGRENIAKAELTQSYTPSEKHLYDVRVVTANAAFAVAKEKCDDITGNAKDVCRAQAKDEHVVAKAGAKVAEKSAVADTSARNKVDAANATARNTKSDARIDASIAIRKADYAVAKEKCDALTDVAKTNCIEDAKARFGQ